MIVADEGLPLTQEAIYSQRLSPLSPFPFYGFQHDNGLVLFTTRMESMGRMTVSQNYCKDNPVQAILTIGTFNGLARAGTVKVEPEPIPSTTKVSRAEINLRLQNLRRAAPEQIYPWVEFPIDVICKSVRNALLRIGHMLN